MACVVANFVGFSTGVFFAASQKDPLAPGLMSLFMATNVLFSGFFFDFSDIPNYFDDPRFQNEYKDHNRNWLPIELLSIAITSNIDKQQTLYKYSNTNSIILGFIIEQITKNSIEYEIHKRILEPLNLCNTNFYSDDILQNSHMKGYVNNKDVTNHDISWSWCAGNLSSDLSNCIHFVKYANTLLNKNAINERYKSIPIGKSGSFGLSLSYGFNLLKIDSFAGHNGSIPGYNTFMLFEASTNTSLVIAINTDFNEKQIPPADIITEYIIAKLKNKANFSDIKRIITKIDD